MRKKESAVSGQEPYLLCQRLVQYVKIMLRKNNKIKSEKIKKCKLALAPYTKIASAHPHISKIFTPYLPLSLHTNYLKHHS